MKKNLILVLVLFTGTMAPLMANVTLSSNAGANNAPQATINFNEEKIENPTVENSEPFEVFFKRFLFLFNNKITAEIDKCIHSDYGLFVLDNPFAFWVAEHFNSFEEIMNLDFEYNIGYLKIMKVDCDYVIGKEPVYTCDEDMWNKEGCFLDKNPKLPISRIYELMINSHSSDVNIPRSEIELAKKSDAQISHLVYNTDMRIGFYFGYLDGRWILFCINKITPCDA